jgi:hypothetical protein
MSHQEISGPFSALSEKLPVLFEILISGANDGKALVVDTVDFVAVNGTTGTSGTLVVLVVVDIVCWFALRGAIFFSFIVDSE